MHRNFSRKLKIPLQFNRHTEPIYCPWNYCHLAGRNLEKDHSGVRGGGGAGVMSYNLVVEKHQRI